MIRRVFVLVLVCVMAMPAALAAELDLSSMSYEELYELRDRVAMEMFSRPEWKRTSVEAGEWTVGVDIPAGAYQLAAIDGEAVLVLVWGAAVNDYTSNGGLLLSAAVDGDNPIGKVNLREGSIVSLSGRIVFAPPITPSF